MADQDNTFIKDQDKDRSEDSVVDQVKDGIKWTTGKSKNGASFAFGPILEHTTEKKGEAPLENAMDRFTATAAASAGTVSVNWPVGDKTWKETSQAVKDLGISRYRLYKTAGNVSWSIYNYRLEFTNTKGWGFTFYDESPDDYTVTTILNGDHSVEYNSSKPTITSVS